MKKESDLVDKLLCAALAASVIFGIVMSFFR